MRKIDDHEDLLAEIERLTREAHQISERAEQLLRRVRQQGWVEPVQRQHRPANFCRPKQRRAAH